jgi:hypothetical protein
LSRGIAGIEGLETVRSRHRLPTRTVTVYPPRRHRLPTSVTVYPRERCGQTVTLGLLRALFVTVTVCPQHAAGRLAARVTVYPHVGRGRRHRLPTPTHPSPSTHAQFEGTRWPVGLAAVTVCPQRRQRRRVRHRLPTVAERHRLPTGCRPSPFTHNRGGVKLEGEFIRGGTGTPADLDPDGRDPLPNSHKAAVIIRDYLRPPETVW